VKEQAAKLKQVIRERILDPVLSLLKRVRYPGKEHISLLDILKFFVIGLQKGDIRSRASAASFDFFLAMDSTKAITELMYDLHSSNAWSRYS